MQPSREKNAPAKTGELTAKFLKKFCSYTDDLKSKIKMSQQLIESKDLKDIFGDEILSPRDIADVICVFMDVRKTRNNQKDPETSIVATLDDVEYMYKKLLKRAVKSEEPARTADFLRELEYVFSAKAIEDGSPDPQLHAINTVFKRSLVISAIDEAKAHSKNLDEVKQQIEKFCTPQAISFIYDNLANNGISHDLAALAALAAKMSKPLHSSASESTSLLQNTALNSREFLQCVTTGDFSLRGQTKITNKQVLEILAQQGVFQQMSEYTPTSSCLVM